LEINVFGLKFLGLVIFQIGVQSRLSAIDVCTEALSQLAGQRRHNASLDEIQGPGKCAFVERHAM
jgi:hypothetical protein